MDAAKIQLSADELQLVQNAGWVLTKNKIIGKAFELFGALSAGMRVQLESSDLAAEILQPAPKVFKGENYKGLPYVMLDYPRYFSHDDIFAIRNFFWWGNYFSVTLHLKGKYKEQFAAVLQKNSGLMAVRKFHVCISDVEWRHELDEENYTPISAISAGKFQEVVERQAFLKLSASIPLYHWNESAMLLDQLFGVLVQVMEISCQDGEKDPSPGSSKVGSGL